MRDEESRGSAGEVCEQLHLGVAPRGSIVPGVWGQASLQDVALCLKRGSGHCF